MQVKTNVPARLAHDLGTAANLLGISKRALYDLIGADQIRTFKVGKRRLVSHQALVDFIEKREHAA